MRLGAADEAIRVGVERMQDHTLVRRLLLVERLERGEILLARFTEEDVAAGSFVTPGGFTRGVVSAFPAKK